MAVARSPTRRADVMAEPEEAFQPSVEEPTVCAMQKLPPFWKANPAMWFVQVEAVFELARIVSDEARYKQLVAQLDLAILLFVEDIIAAPPPKLKYQALKARIVSAFGTSPESNLRRILRSRVMEEEKPSLFLQRMRNLAEKNQSSPGHRAAHF